jgi:hypothetical protein
MFTVPVSGLPIFISKNYFFGVESEDLLFWGQDIDKEPTSTAYGKNQLET